jgi:thiamine-phosphate pyrophosphorylase
VYATSTKKSAAIGLETLAEICAAVRIPVVAIGGITARNAGPCIQAGAAGVAVVSSVFATEDPVAAAAKLRAVVDDSLRARDPQP